MFFYCIISKRVVSSARNEVFSSLFPLLTHVAYDYKKKLIDRILEEDHLNGDVVAEVA